VDRPVGASQPKKFLLEEDKRMLRGGSENETEAAVVAAAGEMAAAGETSFCMAERPHAGHLPGALRAVVEIFALHAPWGRERETVAAGLAGQTEFAAGLPPLVSVRFDHAARMAGMGHEMSQFMEEGAGQFLRESKEAGVEQDEVGVEAGHAGGGAQPGMPPEGHAGGQGGQIEPTGPAAGFIFQLPQDLGRMQGAWLERAGGHGGGG